MRISNVALIGLGSIGSYLAPRLEKAVGRDHFYVIASGDRKRRLLDKGTEINGQKYFFQVADPATSKQPPVDLILIAVKNYNLDAVLNEIGFLVGENTIILSLMNGISSEARLIERYGEEHVVYGLIRVSVNMRDHKVDYDPKKGCVYFGERKNTIPYTSRVAALDELFTNAEIPHTIPDDCEKELWKKFCSNVSENVPCAVIGNCYGSFRTSEHAEMIRRLTYEEAAKIARAKGIDITQEEMMLAKAPVDSAPFYNKPSTRMDIEAKRPTEIEAFSGEVVKIGAALGIPTPINEWLYHAVLLIEEMNSGKIEKK